MIPIKSANFEISEAKTENDKREYVAGTLLLYDRDDNVLGVLDGEYVDFDAFTTFTAPALREIADLLDKLAVALEKEGGMKIKYHMNFIGRNKKCVHMEIIEAEDDAYEQHQYDIRDGEAKPSSPFYSSTAAKLNIMLRRVSKKIVKATDYIYVQKVSRIIVGRSKDSCIIKYQVKCGKCGSSDLDAFEVETPWFEDNQAARCRKCRATWFFGVRK